jgi:hypothetical protein
MTQTINTPAFSAKAAAAAWVSATNAAAKKTIRTRVAETAQKSPRKRWAALLKDIDAGDVARVKARATGDWKAINDAREKAPAKPKAAPKAKPAPKVAPKAAAPAKREAPKANISAVDAAKALAALIEAGMAGSPEAQTILAFIRKA